MSNSAPYTALVRLAVLLLLSGATSNVARAAEEEGTNENAPLVPDIELLEFLGSFRTDSGEWIDPEMLLTDDFDDLFGLAARMDEIANNSNGNDDAANNQQDN